LKRDHYVSDTGDVVYYQTDPKISGSAKSEWNFELLIKLVKISRFHFIKKKCLIEIKECLGYKIILPNKWFL
jgi:hypothetical protein